MSPLARYVYDSAGKRWVSHGRDPISAEPVVSPPPDPIDPLEKPTSTNVGLPGIGNPTMTGTLSGTSYNTSNITYENVHFTAASQITVAGTNVTLRGCKINDRISLAGTNMLMEDCDIGGNIVRGTDITVRRTRATGVAGKDLMAVSSDERPVSGVLIEQCYLGTGVLTSESHLDGLQSRGVNGLTIRYCNFDILPGGPFFESRTNASIFIQNANGGNYNVLIENNWSRINGWYHFYLSDTAIEFNNNTMSYLGDPNHPASGGEPFVFYPSGYNWFGVGNKWEDGTPITIPTAP